MNTVARRVLGLVAGTLVPIIALSLGNAVLSRIYPHSDPEGYIPIIISIAIISLGVGGLLSGLLQPSANKAAMNAVLFSPALWIIPSLLFAGHLRMMIMGVLLTWLPCVLGIQIAKTIRPHAQRRAREETLPNQRVERTSHPRRASRPLTRNVERQDT